MTDEEKSDLADIFKRLAHITDALKTECDVLSGRLVAAEHYLSKAEAEQDALRDTLTRIALMLKNAERACNADNLDAATDYVREALRLIP
jgi:ABC-type transporter Mla subunit MlaD